ncbi:MAG: gamma-glutamyl-gamma-aminobutyrate hydrolase family protein, partial [Candidatus Eremiobacteraeota bacterium]|nr:gamma-glutamyl-gamma-aminobutyrate hydrolase family protein [Candidatus Eremiobacteraeota bacterium]
VHSFDGIVLGPGPGRPRDAGRTLDVLRWAVAAKQPVLGVCLGLQAIGEFFGARLDHAPRLMHGKVSAIEHDGSGLFQGVPSRFQATRYHSLCLSNDNLPAELQVNARSEDRVIQGVACPSLRIHGVQFHPESVISQHGEKLFANFLQIVRGA